MVDRQDGHSNMPSGTSLEDATLEGFAASFGGELIRPQDVAYEKARKVYNAMIDKRPALIVRPTGSADVIDAVNLARENDLPLAVRCGGHSVAGKGVVDDGVLIDLSSLKGVRVDAKSRRARANAGALWGEFDRETQLFGLATPGGRVTTTGVGGFTLGGGYGWLSPKWGLTCDNLTSVDVVTADGRLVTASEEENEDLFWGVRGGGNFGVVTSYEFRLHQLGPMVLGGLTLHPIDDAQNVLRGYRDYVETAPEELATGTVILQAPPAPFIPENLHGKPVLGIAAIYIGDADEGREIMSPIKELGPPAVDMIQPMPYTAFQALLDPFAPQGWLNYTRGLHLSGLPEEAIDTYVEYATEVATFSNPMTQIIIFRNGGAVSRVPEDATAAGHREAAYMVHPIACWQDPAQTERHIDWVGRFSEAMSPFTTGGVYLNFEPDEGEEHVRAGYGAEKYAKLVELKDKWDPENLFRVNQNIKPSRETHVPTPA
jgi:hypothetical protein